MLIVRRSVKDQLRYLAALDPRTVRALRRALELERDRPDGHLAHALLSEITELAPIEYRGRRIERFRLDLYRIVEINVESVARTVRKEFRVVFRENATEPFQFDFDVVIGRTVRRTI